MEIKTMSIDKRIRYTKMFLKEAMLKLLADKPLSRVTVKELCDEADINRSTYYTYYTDPYDQYKKLEDEFIEGATKFVNEASLSDLSKSKSDPKYQLKIVKSILTYIEKHKDAFQIFMKTSEGDDFIVKLATIYTTKFDENIPGLLGSVEERFKSVYATAGSFGIIRYWVTQETPVSVDEMTRMTVQFNGWF
jgi:AcrR family transcriptional regulator